MVDPGEAELAERRSRARATTAFGWLAGGALGLLLNYGVFVQIGAAYPLGVTTFGAFVVGAFGGMAVADRYGPRAFRPLGIAAGVLLAAIITLSLVVWMGRVS